MVEKDNIGQTEEEMKAVQTVEIEADDGTTGSFGKFKSPGALYAAYIGLEAEYTKKCQRLKELERLTAVSEANGEAEEVTLEGPEKDNLEEVTSSATDGREEERMDASDKAEEERIIERYLSAVARKSIPLMRGGGAIVTSQQRRPNSVKEAGGLALKYLQGKNEK